MIPKKTKIRQDGSVWSVVNEETNEVIKHFPTLPEAQRYKEILGLGLPRSSFGPDILGKKSTHMIIDDGVAYPVKDEGPDYHVKPYPYFGDPTKPMEQGQIYTLGDPAPTAPWSGGTPGLDLESLRDMMEKIGNVKPATQEVKLEDFLRKVPMKDMLNAMFYQMADKAGHLGVLRPTDDQYQEICNYIFDHYIDDARKQAPHNRTVDDTKGMKTALSTLLRNLQQYRGIRSAKAIYEDFPNVATVTITIDPAFEFEDEEHMHSWEMNLARLFKEHKPAKLNRLEVMFSRMEVF